MLGSPAEVPKVAPATDDPPIRVWLNENTYQPGDRATIKIRLADDGYVVVLRADAGGHLRILFPLDPGTDNFVKGGKTFEIRARGDRDAFQVDDDNGSGTVFAAVSAQPFTFNGFVLGDHWDYKVLSSEDLGSDPEASMVDLVHNMAGQNHFDYDVTTYTVSQAVASAGDYAPAYYPAYYPCWGCGPWYGGGVFINFGRSYYNSCFYDPFWCDFYGGFGYPYGFGFGYGFYRPYGGFYHPRFAFNAGFHRPFAGGYRPPFVVPTRTTITPVTTRSRFAPSGSSVDRGGRSPSVDQGRRGGGGTSSQPTARRSSPPDRGGRDAPASRRGRNNDDGFTRSSPPARQPASRSEYRPAPRMDSRPAPRMESRSAP
ncbi:MAG TPA: DUF4384 domain-containing protein, partial [Gemmatimonadales bacterium]|nr:DUF4384 domain-containing protein [Gemmatimonadales bacterium]